MILFSAGAERGRRAGEGRSEGRGRQGIGREVRILTSSSSASSARPVYSVSRSPHFGTSLLFLRTPSSLIFVPFLPHLPRRGARSEGGDECRAYVLPGHEVPLHCPGFEIRQAGLPCLRSGSTVGRHWGRPFGLGLVEALPYDLLGGKSLPEPRSGRHLAAEARVPQPRCALYVHAKSLQSLT